MIEERRRLSSCGGKGLRNSLSFGCSTPLSLRGARVVEPGELEVLASPQVHVLAVPNSDSAYDVRTVGWGEVSARFGLVDRVDLQLRIDPSVIPEISAGYQLVGDPARTDDVAVSITGGIRPTFLGNRLVASLPVQVLVEVPLAGELFALTAGVRTVPLVAITADSFGVGVGPGVVAGFRTRLGPFVVQPEVALAANIPGGGASTTSGFQSNLGVQLYSESGGLSVGGQFDFRQPARRADAPAEQAAPTATTTTTPAPADPAAPPAAP